MNKAQLALILFGAALVIMLYQLPRVVVENETLASPDRADHGFEIPEEIKSRITLLRSEWAVTSDSEKKLNFADSLADLYLNFQVLDSAIWFTDYLKNSDPIGKRFRIADLYYRCFQQSEDQEQAKELGLKARGEISSLLEEYPESSSLKNRLAMTLVSTENPMAGIQLLRQIVDENPTDTEAIKNLGILSIQSGQFDKAEARFEHLLRLDSADEEAQFYLGMSRIEQGKEGADIMRKLTSSENPAIRALAQEYLEN